MEYKKNESSKLMDATITLGCNNNCIFCPKELLSLILCGNSREEIIESLRKIRKKSGRVTLTGGEVTIMPDFFFILNNCKNLGFDRISIITNGRMFSNRKFMERVIKEGISDAGISIYSTDERVHDAITKAKGSCKQTMRGISNVMGTIGHLWVNITVSKFNCNDLFATIKRLYGMGVREFLFASVITEDKNIFYNPKHLKEQFTKILREDLPDSTIIFRGFPKHLVNGSINFDNKTIRIESHDFKTFLPLSTDAGKYLSKMSKALGNIST